MNKNQYHDAHRLIRLLRYEQSLLDVFHYPIGFDCECRGEDHCESCEDEAIERAAAREALDLVETEIKTLVRVIEREWLPMVATTLMPNYNVHQRHCELGEYFQWAIIKPLERGERGMSSWNKKTLFDWWLKAAKSNAGRGEMLERDFRGIERGLAKHVAA